jgi:MFS family permease
MVIIVAILSFMMDPGSWHTDKSFFSGVFNPVYGPQLLFRTPMAMVMAGGAVLAILACFDKNHPARDPALHFTSRWTLCWMPLLALGCYAYWGAIPGAMVANMGTALTTLEFTEWYGTVLTWVIGSVAIVTGITALGAVKPKLMWRPILPVPFILLAILLGQFERVREFIRKPYAIAGYLYANGIRKDDYPLLQRDGILKHSIYVSIKEITEKNELQAGKEVFTIACTRCHTVNGINSVRTKLNKMYGAVPWNEATISSYLAVMHQTRTFMPPFPGNEAERHAVAHYLVYLQRSGDVLRGAQAAGIPNSSNGGAQ